MFQCILKTIFPFPYSFNYLLAIKVSRSPAGGRPTSKEEPSLNKQDGSLPSGFFLA
jgi:hypothetical protein